MANQEVSIGWSREDLLAVMGQWRKLHSPSDSEDLNSGLTGADRIGLAKERSAVRQAVIGELSKILSVDSFAKLRAIFSIGRDSEPPAQFDELAAHFRDELAGEINLDREIPQLFEKINLLSYIREGLKKLGQDELARSIENI